MRWDPTQDPGDRFVPETPAEERSAMLRASGYTGWIDQDGYAADSFTPPGTGETMRLPPHGFDCKCIDCQCTECS